VISREKPSWFKRQLLLLFFIVSLLPAMTVSALWYLSTADSPNLLHFGQFITPSALTGLLPAMILSFIFAELLVSPIRRIHQAITQINLGNLGYRLHFRRSSEFSEMAQALNAIASHLQITLKQVYAENKAISAEGSKLRAILDSMGDGVIALDKNLSVVLFNQAAAKLTGLPPEKLAGQNYERILPLIGDGRERVRKWLAGDEPRSERQQWRRMRVQQESRQDLVVNLQAVRIEGDPNGIRVIMTFQDQTREEELEEMKLDFVALAAHELRTPLTAIKGYLDIISHEAASKLDNEQKSYLRRSMSSANELSRLVNNILNVSRIERGEVHYDFRPVNWNELIEDITADLHLRAEEQNRQLIVKIPKNLPKVMADSLAMTEIFNNLVENAFNHTLTGKGKIEISARREGDFIVTTVKDNGTGIPRSALPKLFTKFFRVGGLKSGRGTGLGLYTTKSLVEAHHGYIWVESEEGQGTTFGFSLPVASASPKMDNGKVNDGVLKSGHGWIKNTHS
jgi:two-component system, OmpR family, phosphate regulon sensor histidine kinase PhoR